MANSGQSWRDALMEASALVVLYVIGVFFYHAVEGWGYLDSAYFITPTITTIGYGDFVPKTQMGKIFTILIAFIGISLAFLLIATIALYRKKTVDKHMVNRISILRSLSGLQEKPEEKATREKILKKLMPPT